KKKRWGRAIQHVRAYKDGVQGTFFTGELDDILACSSVAPREDQACALIGKSKRNCAPDIRGCTGYDNDLPRQSQFHFPSFVNADRRVGSFGCARFAKHLTFDVSSNDYIE